MEIDVNHSQAAKPEPLHPAVMQARLRRDSTETPVDAFQSLEDKLRSLPAVRLDKVAHAQSLVEDAKYPPDEMLNRIAHLLAMRIP